MTLTKDQLFKHFTADIQRILYVQQLLQYSLESIKDNPICPAFIKMDANNILSSMKRLKSDMSDKGKGASWQAITEDVSSDRIHDISLLLDTVRYITNINDIITTIQEAMTPETN